MLWAPRTALPHRLALLAYLSVDLLDTSEGQWIGAEGIRYGPDLGTDATPTPGPPLELAEIEHLYETEIAKVRLSITQRRLRELVEVRLGAEPLLAEILRYADRHLSDLLEERTPVVDDSVGRFVYRESFARPDARRYRARFLERYRPPPSKRVLLIVPCSHRKPYRLSRSHRRFARAVEGLGPLERVHWVSVTSPLGVVPRELEDMAPSRNYDIPVTGDWDEAERVAVIGGVRHLVSSGTYSQVVVHLDPGEYRFLRDAWPGNTLPDWTCPGDSPTSSEALGRLREGVSRSLENVGPAPGGVLAVVREELESIARVQWGARQAELLFAPPVRLSGRPWFQRVTDGAGTDLGVWTIQRGLFHLTVPGARRMESVPPLQVTVDEGVPLMGDLFVPGVVDADPGIRVGDAVSLARGGSLVGVGEARLPGRLMKELSRGLAVHVRHRSVGSTEPKSAGLELPP